MPVTTFFATAIAAYLSFVPARAISDQQGENAARSAMTAASDATIWRAENCCGLNCLYLLMRYSGRPADYNRMRSGLIGGGLPASLLDIQQQAAAYDLVVELGQTNLQGLQQLEKPCIAHFETTSVQGKATGHFVLITRINDEGITYVDGSTAETVFQKLSDFERQWSGYVVFTPRSRFETETLWLGTAAVIGCCLLVWLQIGRRAVS